MRLIGAIYSFIAVFLFVFSPLAAAKVKPPESQPPVYLYDLVRQKYSKYELVEMKAKRKSHIEVLDKTKEVDLKLYLAKSGDLRIETLKEPKSITILSDREALVIDEPDPMFGGPLRVLRSKDPGLKDSQSFLRVVFGSKEADPFYKIVGGDKTSVILKAKDESYSAKKIRVEFDPENRVIVRITYWDRQNNEIEIQIEESRFHKQSKPELFQFEIPEDAEVTEV